MTGLAAAVRNDGADRLYQRLGYSDWGHGLVAGHVDETGSAGTVLKTNAGPCCYLTQSRSAEAGACHRCTGYAAPGMRWAGA